MDETTKQFDYKITLSKDELVRLAKEMQEHIKIIQETGIICSVSNNVMSGYCSDEVTITLYM